MATANNNIYEQVYNFQEDDTIPSRVAMVICVLVQRGLLVAGFSIGKELLTLHYTGYNKNKPVWELSFFEHMFAQEPLLTVRERVKGVFISSNRNLVVPDALYDEKEAAEWLRRIYYIEQTDVIESYRLEEDKAWYVMAVPLGISELVKINFKKTPALPLAIYHFTNAGKQSLYLQCCLSAEQATVTLHNYSQLLWHRIFAYSSAEDIAFEIRQLCMENNISPTKVSVRCNAVSAAEYDVMNDLSQYFPGLRAGNGRSVATRWDGAIYLAQQLFSCVS